MPQSKTRKKPALRPTGGKKITTQQKLQLATELCVELVQDLQPHLTEEQHLELRSGALGMLITLSVVTGRPDPRELAPVPGHTPPIRKEQA